MPVFDFSSASEEKEAFVCTYTAFASDSSEKTPDDPILVLDNQQKQWSHHFPTRRSSDLFLRSICDLRNHCKNVIGVFCNQSQWTAFEFKEEDETFRSNILRIDARFVNLIKWLGENRINVLLSGENRADGYAVYKIRENAFHGGTKLSAADGFLQYVMERLLSSSAPEQEDEDEELDESGDSMKLTSIQSISDFLNCAGRTMPDNIRLWARRNLAVARSSEVSAEERRHAQRALSIMTNIQWKNNYFEAIDPDEARRILDEELYGMERVKQRIMETIIQINRTHTLPAYGITTTFVDIFNLEEVENAIQDNTKALYIETLGNPNSDVVDIEAIAKIAHAHKIPLVVDNTFATSENL